MSRRVHLALTVPIGSANYAVLENVVPTRAIASTVPIANASHTAWENRVTARALSFNFNEHRRATAAVSPL